jgi:hypothetical protein
MSCGTDATAKGNGAAGGGIFGASAAANVMFVAPVWTVMLPFCADDGPVDAFAPTAPFSSVTPAVEPTVFVLVGLLFTTEVTPATDPEFRVLLMTGAITGAATATEFDPEFAAAPAIASARTTPILDVISPTTKIIFFILFPFEVDWKKWQENLFARHRIASYWVIAIALPQLLAEALMLTLPYDWVPILALLLLYACAVLPFWYAEW